MSRLIIKESELSQIRKMYLIENVEDKKDGTTMKASQVFWDFIKFEEGDPEKPNGSIKEPVLKAYKDTSDVWTIGYGHTGKDVKPGLVINKEQSLDLLYKDASEAADCVRRFLGEWKELDLETYMLTQGQFDSLVSLVFNSGCGSVRMSRFIQYIKSGQNKKATESILKYKASNNGLKNRRKKESNMFIS
jgi:lysozyme|tara:strand:+ start:1952 stop:2521 length:570 start_codon:yes stop_codon:yes gene_type:complete